MATFTVYPKSTPLAGVQALPEAYAKEVSEGSLDLVMLRDDHFWARHYKKPRAALKALDVHELKGYAEYQQVYIDQRRAAKGKVKAVDFIIALAFGEIEFAEKRIEELKADEKAQAVTVVPDGFLERLDKKLNPHRTWGQWVEQEIIAKA